MPDLKPDEQLLTVATPRLLMTALRLAARERKISMSELVRQTLREKLENSSSTSVSARAAPPAAGAIRCWARLSQYQRCG